MTNKKKQSTEAAVREIRRRTRRKFAPEEKWVPRGYVTPPALADGELVVDLIERIAKWPQSDPTSASAVESDVPERA